MSERQEHDDRPGHEDPEPTKHSDAERVTSSEEQASPTETDQDEDREETEDG